MKFTNKYGKTFKTGAVGVVSTRFNQATKQMILVSFTPSGNYMRCKIYPTPKNVPSRIANEIYLFSTSNSALKGSHMSNTKITF
tara:strand:+ start:76 stop:327 length:252 start_codon:yes stop_codon:yes gene_type:complete